VKDLFADEAVLQRITMITTAPASYSRVTSHSFSTLSGWQRFVRQTYPLREERTVPARLTLPKKAEAADSDDEHCEPTNHRDMNIRSVIDVHAWDQARWRGCGYLSLGPTKPPIIAILFENEKAARKIFERWRTRFGEDDTNDEIGLSIIRELPDASVHHYCVQIAPGETAEVTAGLRGPVLMCTRSMTMEPTNSRNLELFLAGYHRCGIYFLIPAIVGGSEPDFLYELAIKKRQISVKSAADVGENDIESLALRLRGMKFAS
jgi:hypothetical protein